MQDILCRDRVILDRDGMHGADSYTWMKKAQKDAAIFAGTWMENIALQQEIE